MATEPKLPSFFISYDHEDRALANSLKTAMERRKLGVWLDEHNIASGNRITEEIEKGIRESRGVIVLVARGKKSEWVPYEYGFARGAGIPVVPVVDPAARIPESLRHFKILPFTNPREVAKEVEVSLVARSRGITRQRSLLPKLFARFQLKNGDILKTSSHSGIPHYWMDLWIENAPKATEKVIFEIPDRGVRDNRWTVRRDDNRLGSREFLTDDINLYGDVEVWAFGVAGNKRWTTKSSLYDALARYHRGSKLTADIRKALKQIRDN